MELDKYKEVAKEKLGEDIFKMYESYYGEATPWATVSFAQLLENRATQEVADHVYDFTNMFRSLAFNIIYNETITDKVAALEKLSREFVTLVEGATKQARDNSMLDLIKQFNPFKKKERGEFYVFKDANDQLRWVAMHTNKYVDRETEIIASFAHKEFVEAVDAGRWPYPELWVWHASPSSVVGKADFLHFDDDTGIMLSSGTFLKSKEHVATGLASYPYPLRTSHGMPEDCVIYQQVEKGINEPDVIVWYRTREISPLPLGAEANQLTSFAIYA